MRYLEHFEKIAAKRVKERNRHSYYWNDITFFCDYFSLDTLSVLEVGCSTGELLNCIRAKRKVGIDYSSSIIEIARKQFPAI